MALPSGYTQLKHIQSSGTQYIDTVFVPNENTRVVMDFQLNEANTANQALFAVAGQFSFRWYGSSSCFRANGGNNVDFPTTINGAARHTVDKTATACTIDGEQSVTTTAATVTLSLFLLAQHTTSGVSNYASAKLYSCQIYDNGTLVRDFVPAKNSGGTAGLYDTVNGVFYTNAGSGAFTAGPLTTGPVEGTGVSLIGGASYGINDGKCMVGGTAYALTEGKTMVGGTGYDISFGPSVIAVEITGTGSSQYCYVMIHGNQYYSAASGIEVMPGDVITFGISGTSSIAKGYVEVNGETIASRASGTGQYTWTVPEGCKTINMVLSCSTSARYYGRVTVTTT